MARLAVLAGALALTGCVTTENSLSKNDIAAMKLTGVNVSYAPDAYVQWDDGIRAYASAKGITDDQIGDRDQYAGRQGVRAGPAGAQDQVGSRAGDGRSAQRHAAGAARSRRQILHDCVGGAANPGRRWSWHGCGCQSGRRENWSDHHRSSQTDGHAAAGQGVLGTAVQAAIDELASQGMLSELSKATPRTTATGCWPRSSRPALRPVVRAPLRPCFSGPPYA